MLTRLTSPFRRRPSPPKAARARLAVEPLEDRSVPANFTAASVSELVAAIDTANLSPEADTITLVAGKRFTLTSANNSIHGPTGLPVVAAAGGPLTVVGNGGVIARSSTKGTLPFRLVDVAAGAALTLRDLTLQGRRASGVGVEAQGGAVFSLGELVLDHVTVSKNVAEGRAATAGQFAGSAAGGGVYSNGTLTVTDSRVESNAALGGAGSDGYKWVSVTTGYVITYMPTPGGDGLGGGIYVAGGTAVFDTTTITSNTAQGGTGGAGVIGSNPYVGPFIAPGAPGGNAQGGGLFVAGVAASLHGVTVTANQALGGAGGSHVSGVPDGAPGAGMGGGIFFAPGAAPDLDAFTLTHAKRNKASTADPDISGP